MKLYKLDISLVYERLNDEKRTIEVAISENKDYLIKIQSQLMKEIPKYYDDYIDYVKRTYPKDFDLNHGIKFKELAKKYKFISEFGISYKIISLSFISLINDEKEHILRGIPYHRHIPKVIYDISKIYHKYIDTGYMENNVEYFI